MTKFSPIEDANIVQRYSSKTLEKKVKNKTAMQEELGWPDESKRPLICMPAGMSDALGGKLLEEVLPGLLTLPIEVLILGKGSNSYGKLFTRLTEEEGHRVYIVPNREEDKRKMYAAADMALFFCDPSELPELGACLEYGVIPIAQRTKVLENYDPVQERGTAFLYDEATVWHCFAAVVRALETHVFPFDWRTIQKQCMESAERIAITK